MGQYVMAVYGQLMASFAHVYLTAGCDLVHDARVWWSYAGSRLLWLCGVRWSTEGAASARAPAMRDLLDMHILSYKIYEQPSFLAPIQAKD